MRRDGYCPEHCRVTPCGECLEAERDRYAAALAILADESNWSGDPRSHEALLFGHDTPYEVAVAALHQERR